MRWNTARFCAWTAAALLPIAMATGPQTTPHAPTPSLGEGRIAFANGTVRTTFVSASDAASHAAQLVARGDTHLVMQFAGPLMPQDRAALADAGVELLRYIDGNAYFVRAAQGFDVAALADVAPLRATLEPQPAWKMHAMFLAGEVPGYAVVGTTASLNPQDGASGNHAADAQPVIGAYLQLHPDVSLDDAAALVTMYGGVIRDRLNTINALVIELPYDRVVPLAMEDSVQWIEPPLPRMSETNDSNRARVGADAAQSAPYNLDGSGVTVLVYDGGTVRASHVDFGGRATVYDSSGMATHSTHVAGTIGGSGAADGVHRGMAPGVTIVSYGFEYDGSGTFLYTNPGDIEADYGEAINSHNADISNNSIGSNVEPNFFDCTFQGDYGLCSATIDAIVRDGVAGSGPMRIVWAAGNERQGSRCNVEGFGDYYSVAPPGGAKNHIPVGALNSNDDSMTDFSSWGPTDDGRLIPVVSAPGCQSNADQGVTSCSASSDTSYTSLCGTSMAAPTACGVGALLLQDYRQNFPGLPDPRNSTLKVWLAHTAVDLGNAGPDYQFGYGSIRAVPAIDFLRTDSTFEDEVAATGDLVEYAIDIAGDSQLKVTLAWDDEPGTPNAATALVNDLDLRVYDPNGVRYYPWTLDPQNPSAPAVRTQADHRNNIEQVLVDNPVSGRWRVEVYGFNVTTGPQSFSVGASPNLNDQTPIRIAIVGQPPAQVDYDVPTTLSVLIKPGFEQVLAGTARLHVQGLDGLTHIVPLAQTGGNFYEGTLPRLACGTVLNYWVSVEGSISGQVSDPAGAPNLTRSLESGHILDVFEDDMETNTGWLVGAGDDDATAGIWNRMNPEGTDAQPEDDRSPVGTQCWVTDGRAGTSNGTYDVDGGKTTLTSPQLNLLAANDPLLSYWRWYSNGVGLNAHQDTFLVQVQGSLTEPWRTVETVGPSGPDTDGGWLYHQFRVRDYINPTAQTRIRFIAQDDAPGGIVEAAIDDVGILDFGCDGNEGVADCNENGIADSDDIAFGFSLDVDASGVPDECETSFTPGDLDQSGCVDLSDLGILLGCWGNPCADLDGDSATGLSDLGILLGNYGIGC